MGDTRHRVKVVITSQRNNFTRRMLLTVAVLLVACGQLSAKPREIWERYRIAIIAGEGEGLASKAVAAGARDARLPLEEEYNLAITLDDLSIPVPTVEAQRKAMHEAFIEGYDGVLLGVGDSSLIKEEIDLLTKQGIPVVLFGNDIPTSQRLATITTDEAANGRLAAETFIKSLRYVRDHVGIIAGDHDDPTALQRLSGATEVINAEHLLDIDGPYFSDETYGGTIPTVERLTGKDYGNEIRGWLFLGNWPLLSGKPLPWKPGKEVCIAMDATPHIIPYLASGQVKAVISEDYTAMGERGMQVLIEKIHNKQDPPEAVITIPAYLVTKENLAQFQADWTAWMQ